MTLVALGIGGEVADEHHTSAFGLFQCQVHGGIVYAGCLVQVDEITVLGLHEQGGLHGGGTCRSLAAVGGNGLVHPALYLAEPCGLPFILLGIVVASYPPCLVVSGQGKLGLLFLYYKIGEVLLAGELVSEAKTIVEDTEADYYLAVVLLLVQSYEHLVVVIAYLSLLAPDGNPCLVKGRGLHLGNAETGLHVGTPGYFLLGGKLAVLKVGGLLGVLFLELQAEVTVGNDGLAVHLQTVDRASLGIKAESKFHLAVGAGLLLCISCHGGKTEACNGQKEMFHGWRIGYLVKSSIIICLGASSISSPNVTVLPLITSYA